MCTTGGGTGHSQVVVKVSGKYVTPVSKYTFNCQVYVTPLSKYTFNYQVYVTSVNKYTFNYYQLCHTCQQIFL